ncbi:hypothetical protein HYH02_013236 [Chlamydomonas schloesseri]|uniref:Uncharacterized protein n=1 Tax=Chlamydomonas schloesseri TaxID=2026947 RepID=A0A835T0L1_9CHLO|nr:hypothetical protein HYH02_013236 [Chlamydomonas schloesseri]|eukprot:KAG2431659.1 hypothetical protein HYH02_013236 [Chlamydomonas schloesseri]
MHGRSLAFFALLVFVVAFGPTRIASQTAASLPVLAQTWVVNETVVNFYNPANRTQRGGAVPPGAARYAILVNDTMPGPKLDVVVGQKVNITVLNRLSSDTVAIHWHGIRQTGTPWADGAEFVSICPAYPTIGSTSYVFTFDEPGTYFWHSHVGMQMGQGVVGPIVVRDPNDPHMRWYDAEFPEPLLMQDWYWDPVGMLKAPSYHNFNTLEVALVNGRCASCLAEASAPPSNTTMPGATGPDSYTYYPPVYTVTAGLCYRLRLVNANGEFPGWQVFLASHNLTLIALDARNLQPVQAGSLVTYGGNRADLVFCADQPAGDYALTFGSVQQRTPDCPWYPNGCRYQARVYIRYGDRDNATASAVNRTQLAALPYAAVLDPMRRTRDFVPLVPQPAPQPTRSMRVKLGFLAQSGPSGTLAFAAPVKRSYVMPSYPVLFAGGSDALPPTTFTIPPPSSPSQPPPPAGIMFPSPPQPPLPPSPAPAPGTPPLPCGMDPDTHTVTVASASEVLEVVFDNLSDNPHNMHLHGGGFYVLGTGTVAESGWLGDIASQTLCPPELAEHADTAWQAKDPVSYQRFWGCTFSNSSADRASRLNTPSPYISDMVIVPPRGWAVVRIANWHSGVWPLHCHTTHHAMRGMRMLLNVLPAQRPPLPLWVDPFCGPCSARASISVLAPFLNVDADEHEDHGGGDGRGGGAAERSVLALVIVLLVVLAALLGVSVCLVRARRRLRAAQAQARLGWGQGGGLGLGGFGGKGGLMGDEGVGGGADAAPGAGTLLLAPEGKEGERSAAV